MIHHVKFSTMREFDVETKDPENIQRVMTEICRDLAYEYLGLERSISDDHPANEAVGKLELISRSETLELRKKE